MFTHTSSKSIITLTMGACLALWISASHADTQSDGTSSPETQPPKTETAGDNALDDIVFVPHDFGAPEVTDAGAVRGFSDVEIQLLAPPILSKTLDAAPSFYWHVDQIVDQPRFTLTGDTAVEPLLEVVLEPFGKPGVYSLALAAHDVILERPGLYQWSVSAEGNNGSDAPALEIVAQTLFLFEGDEDPSSTSESATEDLARYFADNGYWYDLIDLVSQQIEKANAESMAWADLRVDLLDQIGLSGLLD